MAARQRWGGLVSAGLAGVFSVGLAPTDARACGGCAPVAVQGGEATTVVTGHRMAFSISTDRTVLWDQIQFSGEAEEFAWVLPVKKGAYLELASDAFFDVLDAGTTAVVQGPTLFCPSTGFSGGSSGDGMSCDCGDDSAGGGDDGFGSGTSGEAPPPPPVEVVYQATVGPYETVTLDASEPGVLQTWLVDHGYLVDAEIEPIIDGYVVDGFDFIALRFAPGADTRQMQPVRVVSPGATPTLPLRMVAAGTGPTVDLTLFVISEGRWRAKNFANTDFDASALVWDFATSSSNYAELRAATLGAEDGRVWLTAYARPHPLLMPYEDALGPMVYPSQQTTFAASMFYQHSYETAAQVDLQTCIATAHQHGGSLSRVVDGCVGVGGGVGGSGGDGGSSGVGGSAGGGGIAGGGGSGGTPAGSGGAGGSQPGQPVCGPGEIPAADFACGDFTDLKMALVGLHPYDVWVTRLEASLPREALGEDLELEGVFAASRPHRHVAADLKNPPCANFTLGAAGGVFPNKPRPRRGDAIALTGLAIGIATLCVRAWRRPRRVYRPASARNALSTAA